MFVAEVIYIFFSLFSVKMYPVVESRDFTVLDLMRSGLSNILQILASFVYNLIKINMEDCAANLPFRNWEELLLFFF